MEKLEILKKRQEQLKEQILKNLDIIIGTVGKSPAMKYHNLTTKTEGKTISLYVRKSLVPKVKKMTRNYQALRGLIMKLSKVNWDILTMES
jgi:DNA repair exonuclease SbcCD ATPase subunit